MDLSFIKSLPWGRYGAAVSGGADSVAMLRLVAEHRPGLELHVLHLDHELRGEASAGDAAFVEKLAQDMNLRCAVARRSEIEWMMGGLPANKSAKLRAIRHAFFGRESAGRGLGGVLLAHHADDQAETALHRLLRGSGYCGLGAMAGETVVRGVRLIRPLLNIRREELRAYLRRIGQGWREDASNTSDEYLRNRLRKLLEKCPELHGPLIELAGACRATGKWAAGAAPRLGEEFAVAELAWLPEVLAMRSAKQWLVRQGSPPGALRPGAVNLLVKMAQDAASARRRVFAGGVKVARRKGRIAVVEQDITA